MSKKSFFRNIIGLILALSVFLMPVTPALGYDVVRQFGPITIGDATITIQFLSEWNDSVSKELDALKSSGIYDSVATLGKKDLALYSGHRVVAYAAAFFLNFVADGQGRFFLQRSNALEVSREVIVLQPVAVLSNINGVQNVKLTGGMMYFSPIEYSDSLGWAGLVIKQLAGKCLLAATSGNDIAKFQFRANDIASRLDAASWIVMAFPKDTDKDAVAVEWGNDKQASEVYRPDLGYAIFTDRNNMIQGDIYGVTPLFLFGLVDSALKTKVLVPYADGKLGLNNPITRADLAYMVTKAMGWPEQSDQGLKFWDTRDPRWQNYIGAIGACVAHGILSGYNDNGFWPEETMTRADVACVIYKLLGLGEPPRNPNLKVHNETILTFQVGSPTMAVNGVAHLMDVAPVIVEGRTFLPIRYLAESLKAKVDWDNIEKKVTISSSTAAIHLWIGNPVALVNGQKKPIDPDNSKVVPFILPPGRTMLPLRFVSENLGASVNWVTEDQSITILFDPYTQTPSTSP